MLRQYGVGSQLLQKEEIFRIDTLCKIQECIIHNKAGIRKSGVHLKNAAGDTVYEPPQDHNEVMRLLNELLEFINDDERRGLAPSNVLIKMALIHHRFEAIHPFYDGNGRVGRILNILYLIKRGLLDSPILYLSRYITHNKSTYYQLLKKVQEQNDKESWREWIFYMLRAVQNTAEQGIDTVGRINKLLEGHKGLIEDHRKESPKKKSKIYSQELLNSLFSHPYTTRQYLEEKLKRSYLTVASYLKELEEIGILERRRLGRKDYYVNTKLVQMLANLPRLEDARYNRGLKSIQ